MRSAVLLDRDGTLNVEVNYLHRIEDFVWIQRAPEAIGQLNRAGLPVIVITNQAAVAHGICNESDIKQLHEFMQRDLARYDARVDAFYYCPFHPDGQVAAYRRAHPCRKPESGMFEQAVLEWNIDPKRAFAVGDKNSDVVPARKLGMTTFLVETGYGLNEKHGTEADFVVPDVGTAADQILKIVRGGFFPQDRVATQRGIKR